MGARTTVASSGPAPGVDPEPLGAAGVFGFLGLRREVGLVQTLLDFFLGFLEAAATAAATVVGAEGGVGEGSGEEGLGFLEGDSSGRRSPLEMCGGGEGGSWPFDWGRSGTGDWGGGMWSSASHHSSSSSSSAAAAAGEWMESIGWKGGEKSSYLLI